MEGAPAQLTVNPVAVWKSWAACATAAAAKLVHGVAGRSSCRRRRAERPAAGEAAAAGAGAGSPATSSSSSSSSSSGGAAAARMLAKARTRGRTKSTKSFGKFYRSSESINEKKARTGY